MQLRNLNRVHYIEFKFNIHDNFLYALIEEVRFYTLSGRIGKVVASHAAVARSVPALRLH